MRNFEGGLSNISVWFLQAVSHFLGQFYLDLVPGPADQKDIWLEREGDGENGIWGGNIKRFFYLVRYDGACGCIHFTRLL